MTHTRFVGSIFDSTYTACVHCLLGLFLVLLSPLFFQNEPPWKLFWCLFFFYDVSFLWDLWEGKKRTKYNFSFFLLYYLLKQILLVPGLRHQFSNPRCWFQMYDSFITMQFYLENLSFHNLIYEWYEWCMSNFQDLFFYMNWQFL